MSDCLIVDDSSVVRKVARKILEELKFNCSEAEDGDQALEMCKQKMPNSILLDWNMPKMSGIEFLKHLRALDEGKKPKVIFCTTESEVGYIRKALEMGADEYIMKPFDSEIIQNKFAQVGLV